MGSKLEAEVFEGLTLPAQLGPYRLESLLGGGGMGVVFEAVRVTEYIERRCAVKFIKPSRGDATSLLSAYFHREGRVGALLLHDNILPTLDFRLVEGLYCIEMDLLAGASLNHVIALHRRLARSIPLGVALEVVRQAAKGVGHAHTVGIPGDNGQPLTIIHRDLKPANLLINWSGLVKVADFGLARSLEPELGLTVSGMSMGTPSYMPPEQAFGRTCTPASDVFSLCVVLYEMLTLEPFYPGRTHDEVRRLAQDGTVPDLDAAVPPGPYADAVRSVLRRGLARDAKDRFPTARGLALALQALPIPAVGTVGLETWLAELRNEDVDKVLRGRGRRPPSSGAEGTDGVGTLPPSLETRLSDLIWPTDASTHRTSGVGGGWGDSGSIGSLPSSWLGRTSEGFGSGEHSGAAEAGDFPGRLEARGADTSTAGGQRPRPRSRRRLRGLALGIAGLGATLALHGGEVSPVEALPPAALTEREALPSGPMSQSPWSEGLCLYPGGEDDVPLLTPSGPVLAEAEHAPATPPKIGRGGIRRGLGPARLGELTVISAYYPFSVRLDGRAIGTEDLVRQVEVTAGKHVLEVRYDAGAPECAGGPQRSRITVPKGGHLRCEACFSDRPLSCVRVP